MSMEFADLTRGASWLRLDTAWVPACYISKFLPLGVMTLQTYKDF